MADLLKQIVTPWYTPTPNENLDKTLSLLMFAFLVFVLLFNLGIGGELTQFMTTNINAIILLVLLGFSISQMNARPQTYASFGLSQKAYIGIILGVIIGVVAASRGASILVPTSVISSSSIIGAIFVALCVPFVEEKFFGRNIPFMLNNTFKNPILVIILTSGIFALFHFVAYRANTGFIIAGFIFRVICLVGNGVFQTSTFGDGLHYANNIMAVALCLNQPGLPLCQ